MTNQQLQIYLAPFQGITGAVYREIYTKHFPFTDKLFTPFFTNVYKHKSLSAKARELEKTSHHGIPVIPQILSNDADEIIRFSKICHGMGFDEINWNLGCPFKRVAAKRRGSGLLQHPNLVDEILEKSFPFIQNKLSVKCRLGYESSEEIMALMPVFNKYPLSEIIIHARLGVQIYKGDVNVDSFNAARALSKLPIVYNGDVFEKKDIGTFENQIGQNTLWMIGRGLLVDPFLPGDIKGLVEADLMERKKCIRKFIDDLYYHYRKSQNDRLHAIHLLKELWEYMAFGFNNPKKVFNTVKKTKTFDEYEEAVNAIFDRFEWLGANAGQFTSSML